jgi:hypothetical protein
MSRTYFAITLLTLAILTTAHAGDRRPAAVGPDGGVARGDRSKSLDFDNDVIEGMNKNPLDSLTRVGNQDDKQQGHLYRRKADFRRETRQTTQEMGYSQ